MIIIVIIIKIKKGDKIRKGDTVLIVEAMKMENSIKSLHEGEVKNVFVNKNDVITKNSNLIELE